MRSGLHQAGGVQVRCVVAPLIHYLPRRLNEGLPGLVVGQRVAWLLRWVNRALRHPARAH